MEVILRGRRGGKTTKLIAAWRAHGAGYLLVATDQERDRVVSQYRMTEQEQRRVIVARPDALKGRHGEVFADNLDWIVSAFLGAAVDVATINGHAADAVDPDAGVSTE